MNAQTSTPLATAEIRHELEGLLQEFAIASRTGLRDNDFYMDDLRWEIAHVEAAYVGAAVTEIASLRAVLNGPLLG